MDDDGSTRTDVGRRRRSTPGEHGAQGEQVDAAKGQLAPVDGWGAGLAIFGHGAHGNHLARRRCLCKRDTHRIVRAIGGMRRTRGRNSGCKVDAREKNSFLATGQAPKDVDAPRCFGCLRKEPTRAGGRGVRQRRPRPQLVGDVEEVSQQEGGRLEVRLLDQSDGRVIGHQVHQNKLRGPVEASASDDDRPGERHDHRGVCNYGHGGLFAVRKHEARQGPHSASPARESLPARTGGSATIRATDGRTDRGAR